VRSKQADDWVIMGSAVDEKDGKGEKDGAMGDISKHDSEEEGEGGQVE
jgi:hypothetical protein